MLEVPSIGFGRRDILGGVAGLTVSASLPSLGQAATTHTDGFQHLEAEAKRLGLLALIVRKGGKDLLAYGDTARVCGVHSMRKSFASALFGQAVSAGKIDLSRTLAHLEIDDYPVLTAIEKGATIEDLLKARSGIYLPLPAGMKPLMERPARGAYAPGSHWVYNNWDFNAVGEIYRRLTGKGVFEAIAHDIAAPIGMQDYDPYRDGTYVFAADALGATARYPNYRLALSARDQARFGELYLNHGRWQGSEVIPEPWIARSLTAFSDTGQPGSAAGYGYLWWVGALPGQSGSIRIASAVGAYGHVVAVIPDLDTVVVIQPDTDRDLVHALSTAQTDALLAIVIGARTDSSSSGDKK
jgi:CubicO group peptidase (beta-lactamase class C family)